MLDLTKGGGEGAERENAFNPEALEHHQHFLSLRSADLVNTGLFVLGLVPALRTEIKDLIRSTSLPALWQG